MRVLVIDHIDTTAAMLRSGLGDRVDELVAVRSFGEAELALARASFDLVVLALDGPETTMDGNLRTLADHPSELAIICLDDSDGFEHVGAAIRAGAQEVLHREDCAHPHRLQRVLQTVIERHRWLESARIEAQELRAMNELLEKQALRDPLTGLLNRRGLAAVLDRELARAKRERMSVESTLVLIDLDGFKQVNDQHGHEVGDELLCRIASSLQKTVRASDEVARLGGDEFLVFLPGVSAGEASHVAEKIRDAVRGCDFSLPGTEPIGVGGSLGVVTVALEHIVLDNVIRLADKALYRSKRLGGDRVTILRLQSDVGERPLADVERALRDGANYHVLKQPIVRLSDRSVVGYEIFGRTSIPGFELPDDFFDFSLGIGLLTEVDMRCLQLGVRADAALASHERLHLNLFPATLIDAAPDRLRALVDGFEDHKLCIEVSQRHLVGDPLGVSRVLDQLRACGAKILLDDLGFDTKSLEGLMSLRPDFVKVDLAAMTRLAGRQGYERLLRRLLRAIGNLPVDVIAEGVEYEDQLPVLADLSVKEGQGIFFAPPS